MNIGLGFLKFLMNKQIITVFLLKSVPAIYHYISVALRVTIPFSNLKIDPFSVFRCPSLIYRSAFLVIVQDNTNGQ